MARARERLAALCPPAEDAEAPGFRVRLGAIEAAAVVAALERFAEVGDPEGEVGDPEGGADIEGSADIAAAAAVSADGEGRDARLHACAESYYDEAIEIYERQASVRSLARHRHVDDPSRLLAVVRL